MMLDLLMFVVTAYGILGMIWVMIVEVICSLWDIPSPHDNFFIISIAIAIWPYTSFNFMKYVFGYED